eukprot:CAMPEP_0179211776 /NCGR_PEP_ID=MMETSP0797-20121207/678_1 /TAXON_ID=47934 /ORGANISM="Dinophysis acuminata, Strain DAEP01" /LENGTH=49 /DNA_ID=CAMNT_0020917195 /DNA_START=77 /DNA_END=226 /DNA_ORIENTATION=+
MRTLGLVPPVKGIVRLMRRKHPQLARLTTSDQVQRKRTRMLRKIEQHAL